MNSPLRKRARVFLSVTAALCAAALAAGQENIAHYTLNTDLTSSANSLLATASALNLQAGGTRSTALAGTGLDNQLGSYAKTNGSNAIVDSFALALSNSHYLSFTVSPTESLNVLSLNFDFAVSNNTTSVDPYIGSWAVLSSATGFTSDNVLATGSLSTPKSTGLTAVWTSESVNLGSVASLQNTVVSSIEFRIYFWDNSATSTTNLVMRFDDIALSASTAIPEPGTYAALAGLLALGFVVLRRRGVASA